MRPGSWRRTILDDPQDHVAFSRSYYAPPVAFEGALVPGTFGAVGSGVLPDGRYASGRDARSNLRVTIQKYETPLEETVNLRNSLPVTGCTYRNCLWWLPEWEARINPQIWSYSSNPVILDYADGVAAARRQEGDVDLTPELDQQTLRMLQKRTEWAWIPPQESPRLLMQSGTEISALVVPRRALGEASLVAQVRDGSMNYVSIPGSSGWLSSEVGQDSKLLYSATQNIAISLGGGGGLSSDIRILHLETGDVTVLETPVGWAVEYWAPRSMQRIIFFIRSIFSMSQ